MRIGSLLLLLAAPVGAQMVDGTVVDATTGAPVSGVSVRSVGGSPDQSLALTDATGRFRVSRPTSELVRLVTLHRTGYLDQNRTLGAPGDTSGGSLRVELMPQAVITGKIVDEDGIPVEGIHVAVARARRSTAMLRFLYPGSAESNEQGEYRLFGLAPGRYFIHVETSGPIASWDPRYVPQYRGGTLQPGDQSVLEVKAGQEIRDVDITLKRFEGVKVTGRITGPSDVPIQGMSTIEMRAVDSGRSIFTPVRRQMDGSFEIRHVTPGKYVIVARSGTRFPAGAGDWMASQTVEVGDSDVSDVELNASPLEPVSLAGVVVRADGSAARSVRVALSPDGGNSVSVMSGDDGIFRFKELLPGHYRIRVNAMPRMDIAKLRYRGAMAIAARFGDADVLEKGLDVETGEQSSLRITVAEVDANLTGTLTDAGGHPLPGAILRVQGDAPAMRFTAQTDETGKFRLWAAAGTYRLYVAASEADVDTFDDPDYLSAHANDYPALTIPSGGASDVVLRPDR